MTSRTKSLLSLLAILFLAGGITLLCIPWLLNGYTIKVALICFGLFFFMGLFTGPKLSTKFIISLLQLLLAVIVITVLVDRHAFNGNSKTIGWVSFFIFIGLGFIAGPEMKYNMPAVSARMSFLDFVIKLIAQILYFFIVFLLIKVILGFLWALVKMPFVGDFCWPSKNCNPDKKYNQECQKAYEQGYERGADEASATGGRNYVPVPIITPTGVSCCKSSCNNKKLDW